MAERPPLAITYNSHMPYFLEGDLRAQELISIQSTTDSSINLSGVASIITDVFLAATEGSLNIATSRDSQVTLTGRSIDLRGDSLWVGPSINISPYEEGSVLCNNLFLYLSESGHLSQGQQTIRDLAESGGACITYIDLLDESPATE